MPTSVEQEFVVFSADKLTQLCSRIEDCLGRLTPEQVWQRGSENENAIGNLVLHLCGNLGQWIGSGVAGRPDLRKRDHEFDARGGFAPAELAGRIHHVVEDAVSVIKSVSALRLLETVEIKNYKGTVLVCIYHVVEHFSMHAGQIMFATKLLTGEGLGYYRDPTAAAHKE